MLSWPPFPVLDTDQKGLAAMSAEQSFTPSAAKVRFEPKADFNAVTAVGITAVGPSLRGRNNHIAHCLDIHLGKALNLERSECASHIRICRVDDFRFAST